MKCINYVMMNRFMDTVVTSNCIFAGREAEKSELRA